MITPNELWFEAIRLADLQGDEVQRRNAVDTFYFAAFLQVRLQLGFRQVVNPHGSHIAVIEQLKHQNKFHQRAGHRLDNLRRLRNQARYDIHLNITKLDVDSARQHAEAVRTLLENAMQQ